MARKKVLNITEVITENSCFNLQFRKDARRSRTNSPTYYRWQAQFVITLPKRKLPYLLKIRRSLKCGNISLAKNQARFSIQKIKYLSRVAIPFFKESFFSGKKEKDFQLWKKAVHIMYANKGKYVSEWAKHEMLHLIHIHEAMLKNKKNPRQSKWIEMAKSLTKTSPPPKFTPTSPTNDYEIYIGNSTAAKI